MTYERTALVRDAGFQTRDENGSLTIEGYFAVFGSEYRMWENAVETIAPEAFDDTLGDEQPSQKIHEMVLLYLSWENPSRAASFSERFQDLRV